MEPLRKILVTGASGFVGKHLVRGLCEAGYQVVGLVRENSDTRALPQLPDCHLYYLEGGLEKLFFDFEIQGIIHTATSYGKSGLLSEVLETNLVLPVKLIEAGISRGLQFFINTDTFFTKSSGTYQYLNQYTQSKQFFMKALEGYRGKIKCINFKLEHVYGEGDGDSKFVTQILRRLLANEPAIDLTDGLQRRDFIYVKDVVSAYRTILEKLPVLDDYTELEVGTGESVSIRQFTETAKKLTTSTSVLNFGALATRPGEFSESKADNERLRILGWRPTFNLTQGLTKIITHEKSIRNDTN
ncbi:NAD(P)-dependent oxidoreductase [Pedobacter sp. SYSU D00535]|uniref:NAD-dependent epimerase/dehydratase family protein n=1 Tax=Pedobacter sp. SYSU D00535 TaxID=2810308 RepID=UPI001A96B782|nr:NAD(P)-dependent oxidoreductase [Pedobacter sp. SYSU D00535]